MTDVYTVIFTETWEGEAESVPWILSFSDLELAKNHVREEAAQHAEALEIEPASEWQDFEDYSFLTSAIAPECEQTWLIVRTELVEAAPSGEISS